MRVAHLDFYEHSLTDLYQELFEEASSDEKTLVAFCDLNMFSKTLVSGEFSAMIRSFQYVLDDGSFLKVLKLLLGISWPTARIPGPDFFEHTLLRDRTKRHFFLGSSETTLGRLRKRVAGENPGLQVSGFYSPPFEKHFSETTTDAIIERVNATDADVLWVSFGCPKQESWIRRNAGRLKPRIILAVGAAFDFYARTVRRAPRFLRRAGLEFLFRMMMQPRIASRTATAAIRVLRHFSQVKKSLAVKVPSMRPLQRFVLKVASFFTVGYGLVVGLNLTVDPTYILRKYDPEVVRIVLDGKNAALSHLVEGVDMVSIKLIESNEVRKPDFAVLGSSRTSEIESSYFSGKHFLNFSIPGGNLVQQIGLYQALKENGKLPREILLNVEPWEFYPFQGEYWWVNGLSDYYRKGLMTLDGNYGPFHSIEDSGSFSDRVLAIASIPTFQLAVQRLISHRTFETDEMTGNWLLPAFIYRHDGSYSLASLEKLDPMRVASEAEKFIAERAGSFFGPERIKDDNALRLLSDFLGRVQADGVKVTLFFSPVNPKVWDHFRALEPNVVEVYVKNLAAQRSIPAIGTFDPYAAFPTMTVDDKFFIDGIHLTSLGMNRLLMQYPELFSE